MGKIRVRSFNLSLEFDINESKTSREGRGELGNSKCNHSEKSDEDEFHVSQTKQDASDRGRKWEGSRTD